MFYRYQSIHRFLPIFFLMICLALCLGQSVCAKVDAEKIRVPEAGKTQIITLNDGSTLTGRIVKVGEGEVTFSSNVGQLTIQISQIDDIQEISSSQMKGGKYWFPNPNRTRLYFGPTGHTLEKGKGYFSDLLLFFPSVTYGVTDNISIGGGMSLFPGVDFDKQLIYIFPKIGMQATKEIAIAGSMIILRIPEFDEDLIDEPKAAGIIFGTATYGTENLSLTGGLGFGYVDEEIADKPAVLVGGEWRFARRVSFVTENWVFPGVEDALISYGLRFFGESLSADLGLFTTTHEDSPKPGIPLVSFTYNF